MAGLEGRGVCGSVDETPGHDSLKSNSKARAYALEPGRRGVKGRGTCFRKTVARIPGDKAAQGWSGRCVCGVLCVCVCVLGEGLRMSLPFAWTGRGLRDGHRCECALPPIPPYRL